MGERQENHVLSAPVPGPVRTVLIAWGAEPQVDDAFQLLDPERVVPSPRDSAFRIAWFPGPVGTVLIAWGADPRWTMPFSSSTLKASFSENDLGKTTANDPFRVGGCEVAVQPGARRPRL